MDKGYYVYNMDMCPSDNTVAIHNKNGQGLLLKSRLVIQPSIIGSQSTIKMDKGYYKSNWLRKNTHIHGRNPQ